MSRNILITGSAGRIGQAVAEALGNDNVRGLDRVPTPGLADHITGSITDPATLEKALKNIHTVIHLAATPDDDDDFLGTLLPNNVVGVYHLMECARAAGVKRLILASSGQVVWYQRMHGPYPVTTDTLPTPRYWYAATKMFLEAAGRAFSEKYGQSVIVVRLGWCPRPGQEQEIAGSEWAQDVYLSPNDAGRFFACCVQAPQDLRFAIVYAASKPVRQCPYDMELAKRLLGYEPQEKWPQGVDLGGV